MKILLIMDPGILVPPKGYGGIERLVEIFAKEYRRLGHEVHLLVTEGSYVEGCVMHPFGYEGFPPKKIDALKAIPVAWKFLRKNCNEFDLIHNFGRLAYLLPILHHPVKKIMTYEREITTRNIKLANFLKSKNFVFTACSANLLSRLKTGGNWEVVYNAIEFSKYTLREDVNDEAPLIFLGRIEKIKGCHTAIAIAKATGNKLIIAGNISPLKEEREYYEKEIKPFIDGEQIQYVGALDDEQKNFYLGMSKAMIFPIEWNEPFGIVMIEAMACGTPVIGFELGSVGEVIDDGITGFKVKTFDEMVESINKLSNFNRKNCRDHAKKRFDVKKVTLDFLNLFSNPSQIDKKRIVLITTGQPSVNPRIVKEADSFYNAGYDVTLLYCFSVRWALESDEKLLRNVKWKYKLVGGTPLQNKFVYYFTKVRFKTTQLLNKLSGNNLFIAERAQARCFDELLSNAKALKADWYIGHNLGALPIAVKAAKKNKAKSGFDFEDYHREENETPVEFEVKRIIYLEKKYLNNLSYISTASPLITEKIKSNFPDYPRQIITILNCFPLAQQPPFKEKKRENETLHFFWFSQTIGKYRGLEAFIMALKQINDSSIHLTLAGRCNADMLEYINNNAGSILKNIHLMGIIQPEDLPSYSSAFDVGLAIELNEPGNRNICLTNKVFTYLLAGNAVILSDTAMQETFNKQYNIGLTFPVNDVNAMIDKIIIYKNKELLERQRKHNYYLAKNVLNWDLEFNKLDTTLQDADHVKN